MPGREQSLKLSVAVSSGSGTGSIAQTWDICRRLRVIPPSENATYTVTVYDGNSYMVFRRDDWQGTFSEVQELSLGICRSVAISEATEDGNYVFCFDMH